MIYVASGQAFTAFAEGAPTGLVGTMTVAIYDSVHAVYPTPAHTSGIVETPAGSGLYYASLTAPVAIGTYSVQWNDGLTIRAEDLIVVASTTPNLSSNLSGGRKTIPVFIGTQPDISDTIIDEATGLGLDLTGAVVELVVQDPSGVQTAYTATAGNQVTDPGSVSIETPAPVSAALSYWLAWWRVTIPGPQVQETQTFAIVVIRHGQETPVPVGPCSSWITGDDVMAFCPEGNAALADQAAAWATDVLFGVLARQFKGVCSDTIRPTRLGCGCWSTQQFGGIPLAWGFWAGVGYAGWGFADVPQPIGCGWLSEYELAYPVSQVLQVKVGGQVLDPARYRVDEQKWLVRLPDANGQNPGWPVCQDMSLPDTASGTWSVAYTYGVAPPQLALDAAKQLACQLSLAASGQPCSLPTGTTKVTRAGITIERGLLADWTKGGSTGLVLVDAAIRAYNPNQLQIQTAIYSPDLPKFGRHTGS